jgi:predicted metal-binding protein
MYGMQDREDVSLEGLVCTTCVQSRRAGRRVHVSDGAILKGKIMNILISKELEGNISRATLIAVVIV